MFRSPAKTSAAASGPSSRWSKQEKELFEEGLVSFSCQHTIICCCLWNLIASLVYRRRIDVYEDIGVDCVKYQVAEMCFSAGSVWSKVDKDCQVGRQPFCSSGQELCQTVFQTQGETRLYFLPVLRCHLSSSQGILTSFTLA